MARELYGRVLAAIFLPFLIMSRQRRGGAACWLIGENQGECLDDNGYAFYRYCRDRHPEEPVYFLVKRSSANFERLFRDDPNAVLYGSWRHMRLFLQASLMFYTHTYRDLMYRRFFEIYGRRRGLVYLHHGTLAFKKFDAFYQRNRNIMRLFTVGSELERRMLVEQAGVDEFRVRVTGYARTDLLKLKATNTARQILFVPTHRRHLAGSELREFRAELQSLLDDPDLLCLLEKHDVVLKVYLHAHSQKVMALPRSPAAKIHVVKQGEESLRDLICESMLMVTDYSSVCWDFMSLGKPVLFYRFDLASYQSARDAYIDLRDSTYGEIAYERGELLRLIEGRLESGVQGVQLPATAIPRSSTERFGNCARIYKLARELHECPV
ncbi:CDP-glycerol glycerophosphotransferase family protein [Haliea sp. E17]|uniref:CDP-glycerol glycerophosphotransferase family protein n=1 Tax=Haliea sp. E17 TaxID=3401576 RepID=UPI003AAC7AF0